MFLIALVSAGVDAGLGRDWVWEYVLMSSPGSSFFFSFAMFFFFAFLNAFL